MTGLNTGVVEIENDAYHADTTRVSHSALEIFRRSIPLYHGRYIAKTIESTPSSDSQRLGSLVDCMLLESEKLSELFTVQPECDRRTKEGKAIYADWLASFPGGEVPERVTVMKRDEWDKAEAMRDATLAHPDASYFLALDGLPQHTICFTDPDTGVPCKARLDKWIPALRTILEIKTARDSSAEMFQMDSYKHGYGRQFAMFATAVSQQYGIPIDEVDFIHVVIGNTAPHEVNVYRMDPYYREYSLTERNDLLVEYAQRKALDDWSNRQKGIGSLRLPMWADRKKNPLNEPMVAPPVEDAQ